MQDSIDLGDSVVNAYNVLENEKCIDTDFWYSGMYLNIYNLYETYMTTLFETFVDIVCGDSNYNIMNLPLNFIVKNLDVSGKNLFYLFSNNLEKEIGDNKQHNANKILEKIKNSFQFTHFGKQRNNEKIIEKLNIILSERQNFSKDSGDWFSKLSIKDRLIAKELEDTAENIEISKNNRKLVQSFFLEYSKDVRHKLAHEFIRGEKMSNIKKEYPITETIEMFKEAIKKIDNQFKYIYGRNVEFNDSENLFDLF